ncbi:hypothetical protein V1504DRAFT_42751, partial [Lipomyces starkeyi]
MSFRRKSDLTRNSTPSSGQSEEPGKRFKWDSSRDSTLPATEISSTMSFTESKNDSPAREDTTDSDYNKALVGVDTNKNFLIRIRYSYSTFRILFVANKRKSC